MPVKILNPECLEGTKIRIPSPLATRRYRPVRITFNCLSSIAEKSFSIFQASGTIRLTNVKLRSLAKYSYNTGAFSCFNRNYYYGIGKNRHEISRYPCTMVTHPIFPGQNSGQIQPLFSKSGLYIKFNNCTYILRPNLKFNTML